MKNATLFRSPGRLGAGLRHLAAALAVVAFASGTASAQYVMVFDGVTNNSVADTTTGENQLRLSVNQVSGQPNQVAFTFTNTGPLASSITDVYFDDGTLLGIASITDSGSGVEFAQGASPGNLPGGNAINFNTTAGFSADSTSPTQQNGVNPGESLTVIFNLISGQTYASTIAAIQLSLANPGVDVTGGLRIGIHVQGFAGGGSDSFVGTVPEPASLAMVGMSSLVGLGYAWRKRKPAAV